MHMSSCSGWLCCTGFAVVKLATNKQTGEEYAVKIMNLPDVAHQPANDNENTREDIFKEIDILVGMEHENVLNLKEYYEEGGKVCALTCKLVLPQSQSPRADTTL